MENITTSAIVLRRVEYKDNDCLLTLFSPTLGRIEALSRGCRRQKSPLLAASELFASGEYVLWQGPDRAIISSCALSDSYYPLREDFDRLSHAMYMLELCLGCVQPEEENGRLFMLLLRSLAHLAYGSSEPRRVTAVFLMGLVSLQGYRPSVGRCQRCGTALMTQPVDETAGVLSAEAGGVICPACGLSEFPKITGSELAYLQSIMRCGLAELEEDHVCTDTVFGALRDLVEKRLDVTTRSGRLL